MNHDVPARGNLRPMTTQNLTNSPPHPVAHHRPAESLLDAESKPAQRQSIGAKENGEV